MAKDSSLAYNAFSGPHKSSKNACTSPTTFLHLSTIPMATASAIPQNLSLFHPNQYYSTAFTTKHFKPTRFLVKGIRSKLSVLDNNGVPIGYNRENNFSKASQPFTVLGPHSKFLHPTRRITVQSLSSNSGVTSTSLQNKVIGLLHLLVSLGIILAMDKLLKKAFVAAAIKFPSALFGMFCIFTILMALDSTVPAAATGLMNFFEPALLFIQRWLPLFYVPSLVALPLAVKDIPATSGVKICIIIVGGWLASLAVAGYTAIAVRKMVNTEMIPAEPMSKPSPFSQLEIWAWSGIFVISFIAAFWYPTVLGTSARTCLPFLLASTVLGYMVGSGLPSGLKKVFHPVICCALSADLAAFAFGYFTRSGLNPVLGYYLTKASSNPGAGDILMGFLGSVILSFAFSMFKQRKLVKRHAAEIFTSVIISTLFSLYSTALIGRLLALEPSLTISILPRCITVALALSIVSFFEGANSSLTAAAVVVTGLIGANFVQTVLDNLRFRDPIARGIATASSAHGLGTAALSAKEPEALPFCAIAYGLTGIFGSLACSIPAVRQSLLAVVG
ncbi:plastidal glycolate/glycerate translocator 1, chloroplastic-like [Coffea eugenioides]|uniref:plastidal glycolate/glycerate translocator 1, chloroplastic-like n=1 Tax=Coffea eugenioides TaxID=49369 RepID=UPI000F611CAA|nr:plastidal glycolate/glycerate translocator 1, chloroplastic-like [Coffea eugenioides]